MSRSLRALAALAFVALAACNDRAPEPAGAATPTPQPTATVVKVIEVPTPAKSDSGPTKVEVTQEATLCGAEKLQNYLNLLPTATAKEEIAKAAGHNRIRYVGPKDVVTQEFREDRLTAELGVDGRIKEFRCG
jgi:hypothetical protein